MNSLAHARFFSSYILSRHIPNFQKCKELFKRFFCPTICFLVPKGSANRHFISDCFLEVCCKPDMSNCLHNLIPLQSSYDFKSSEKCKEKMSKVTNNKQIRPKKRRGGWILKWNSIRSVCCLD